LKTMIAKILGNDPARIDSSRNISEYGADSVLVMELAEKLSERFGDQLHHQTILDYPTVASLAAHIQSLGIASGSTGNDAPSEVPASNPNTPPSYQAPQSQVSSSHGESGANASLSGDQRIAVVGMAGRFPKSFNVDIFWERLRNGEDLITEVPPERFDISPWLNSNVPNHNTYTKKGGFVEGVEYFDPEFFNIKEEDARIIDPQQRIFLELVQEAMDRGGYRKRDLAGTETAVFVGAGESEYAKREKETKYEGKNGVVNTITNLISSRVSDFYDLHGPSWTVHTACSSSLIAIHNGCQSILTGESEMAIAGGTEFLLEESFYIGFTNSKVLSPDGKCKTFDKKANGFVLGEGAGVVILKSYAKAMADGDRIFGVILASAANNDGKTMGLTTPNIHAQKKLIQAALRRGQINPETISYFEAHGTGTNLGDPIEVKAASEVFSSFTKEKNFCAIGSVKSNMGHSLMASGIASFIKVLLAMRHQQIPPTLHCDEPHPGIGFGNLPFYPVTQLQDWRPRHGVRRAGISSFGFGGTNAHIIVEEADPNYKPHREVLPPTHFKRRRIWVDAKGAAKPQVFIPAAGPSAPSKVIMENNPVYSSNSPSAGGGLKEVMAYLKQKVAATLKTSPDSIAET
ncbi:MAG: hypothetical protein JNM63_12925, partial [Spirochaetia bacterium]|nr:hypothetical protein [Spirochaetia bacterium]